MTREEAIKISWTKKIEDFVDNIYDDFESMNCDNCQNKPKKDEPYPFECGTCSRFYGDKFERKD